jgi:hypothetical protein
VKIYVTAVEALRKKEIGHHVHDVLDLALGSRYAEHIQAHRGV